MTGHWNCSLPLPCATTAPPPQMQNSLLSGSVFQVLSPLQNLLAFVYFLEPSKSCFLYALVKCWKIGLVGPYATNLEV